jgi:hypothetical protein
MAVNNRAEAIIVAEAALVPTLTLAQHKAMLNENILNSVVFDKDVIASETPVAGAVTIDYSDKDLATVTTAINLAVSFTNLENGAVKYLEVTKSAANVISFVGALDMVDFREYINTVETVVCYRISNKNGIIYVEALFNPQAQPFQDITPLVGTWNGNVKYRINYFTRKVDIDIAIGSGATPATIICTVPSIIKPSRLIYKAIVISTTGNPIIVTIEPSLGQMSIQNATVSSYYGSFSYDKTL